MNALTNILSLPLAHLTITAGKNEDWIDTIAYVVEDSDSQLDLRGIDFEMEVRRRAEDPQVIISASTLNQSLSIGAIPNVGHLIIYIPESIMSTLFAGPYVGDIRARDARFQRVCLTFDLTIIEGITRGGVFVIRQQPDWPSWAPTAPGEGVTFPDAPEDGLLYGRRNAQWREAMSSDGGTVANLNISGTLNNASMDGIDRSTMINGGLSLYTSNYGGLQHYISARGFQTFANSTSVPWTGTDVWWIGHHDNNPYYWQFWCNSGGGKRPLLLDGITGTVTCEYQLRNTHWGGINQHEVGMFEGGFYYYTPGVGGTTVPLQRWDWACGTSIYTNVTSDIRTYGGSGAVDAWWIGPGNPPDRYAFWTGQTTSGGGNCLTLNGVINEAYFGNWVSIGSNGLRWDQWHVGGAGSARWLQFGYAASNMYALIDGATAVYWPITVSDRRLKSNINASGDAIGLIRQIPIHACDLGDPVEPQKTQHLDFAVIADEVKKVVPSAFLPAMEGGYESIRELPLISLLLRAVQQLSDKIEDLSGGKDGRSK